MENEFKVGDRVTTTNRDYASYGEVKTIQRIDRYMVHISSGGWWNISETQLAPNEIVNNYEIY